MSKITKEKDKEVTCMKCNCKLTKSAGMYKTEDIKKEYPYCFACAIEKYNIDKR